MKAYYEKNLAARRLMQCYSIAPPRVQQYFREEMAFVLKQIRKKDIVLDLGCGYGRIIPELARKARFVFGIDTSLSSLLLGKEYLKEISNVQLLKMDAANMEFTDGALDVVICIQNGLSAFHVDQRALIKECIRVTKPGGIILFSSYAEKFWEHRMEWFRLQSDAGLIGEIDEKRTRDGKIVCRDGFIATTVGPGDFRRLTRWMRGIEVSIREVDGSSVFFRIQRVP